MEGWAITALTFYIDSKTMFSGGNLRARGCHCHSDADQRSGSGCALFDPESAHGNRVMSKHLFTKISTPLLPTGGLDLSLSERLVYPINAIRSRWSQDSPNPPPSEFAACKH